MTNLAESFGFTTNMMPDPEKWPKPVKWMIVAFAAVIVWKLTKVG